MMTRILLIEDDKTLSEGIAMALGAEGRQVEQCFSLREARAKTEKGQYDLLILDINLPDGNGLDFLKEWKGNRQTPVMMLTANDMETDVVMGLELGAADYITKPFSLAILRARVNTQLRNSAEQGAKTKAEGAFGIDEYMFDFDRMLFSRKGVEIELSKTEQKLLKILVENRGRTLERSRLVDYIWTDGAEYVDENALSVTVKRLRDKLEEQPSRPLYIKTVYGVGYTWANLDGRGGEQRAEKGISGHEGEAGEAERRKP